MTTEEDRETSWDVSNRLKRIETTLKDVSDQLKANGKMTRDIHSDLYEVPDGSPSDEKPLIEMMRTVARAWSRTSWGARVIGWIIAAITAAAIMWAQVKEFFVK